MTAQELIAAAGVVDARFREQTAEHIQRTTWAVTKDPAWWASRIDEVALRWECADRHVAGTLWWYAASYTLCGMLVVPVVVSDAALVVGPDMPIAVRPDGYLGGCRPDRVGDAAEGLDALRDLADGAIAALASASGASERALWAIFSDSLALRALAAGEACDRIPQACSLAVELAGALTAMGIPCPAPRFVDVGPTVQDADARGDVPVGARRRVRRSSCCLIYQVPGSDKCISCPRQRPHVRADRLLTATG